MDNRTHVGLDVHKETTAVAVLRPDVATTDDRVIATTPEAYRKLVKGLKATDVVFCYEAGPCGFDPYRMLSALGADCEVIAPTLVPRRSGRKVKTDRIDAAKLARLHRAGELTTVRVPTPEHEAVRDLIRVREDLKLDRRRAIQQLKSFLLRHGLRYPKRAQGWSQPYENWVCSLSLEQSAAQDALNQMIASAQTRHNQLLTLDRRIQALAEQPPLVDAVTKLRVLKGIDTLSAATIAAEAGDFAQFASAPAFMAYVGLVPANTPPDNTNGEGRSPRPATRTCDASSSKPPGPTDIAPPSAHTSDAATQTSPPSSSPTAGRSNNAPTTGIEPWPPPNIPTWPWSPSPANSPASSGLS